MNNPELYIMENKIIIEAKPLYIFCLDHQDGKVYKYEYGPRDIEESNAEDFLMQRKHSITNCEWMVTETDRIYGD